MRAAVLLHGEVIGSIERDDSDLTHRVRFLDSWRSRVRHPVLGQWFEDNPGDYETSGLPNYFAHLLPEGDALRMYARRLAVDPEDHLEILTALGLDLAGAVQVLAEEEVDVSTVPASVEALAREGLRFGLAGVQRKISLDGKDRGFTVRLALDGRHWIAKLPGRDFPGMSVAEMATLEWARASGIAVPEVRLLEIGDLPGELARLAIGTEPALLIERFDRGAVGPVHIEDFCQVLDVAVGDGKYRGAFERIPRVLHAIGDEQGAREWIVRMVHIVASGNGDAHLKNWSLRYGDRRTPQLAPAYDLVPTVLWPEIEASLQLTLGGRRSFEEIDEAAFRGLLGVYGRELPGLVEDAVRRVLDGWMATRGRFPPVQREVIEAHLRRVPLLRAA